MLYVNRGFLEGDVEVVMVARRAEVGGAAVVVEVEVEVEVEEEGGSVGEGSEISGEVRVAKGHSMSLIIGMIKAREKTRNQCGTGRPGLLLYNTRELAWYVGS